MTYSGAIAGSRPTVALAHPMLHRSSC